ncbi:MAG: ribonuclease HI [Verrucomicrobia bacterium]|nr:ribonuclease HI [Verrucomicrobiota bacterium]
MKQVTIYTDGAAKGNPGPGGYGTLLVHNGKTRELSGGFSRTTNNRMELLAAITGLEALTSPCKVTLHSDSRYLVDAMNKGWLRGWKARRWSRANNQHLKNADLWQRLDAATTTHDISWRWVKGHAGHPENERADELASMAAAEAALRKPAFKGQS